MAFTNQAVLSCSKCLCFSRETLQEGNFPLGGRDLAQLGLGEGGKGHAVSCLQRMWTFLRSVRKVGAAPGRRELALCSGGSCVTVMGRAGNWTAPTVGGVPLPSLCSTLLSLGPWAFHTLGLDGRCGHQLPGPSLPELHSPRLQDEKLGPRPSWPSSSSTSD